ILVKSTALGYWNGGTAGTVADWDNSPGTRYTRWQTVSGTTSWTKTLPPLAVVDSDRFYVWVRATNGAANTSATPANGQLDLNPNAVVDVSFLLRRSDGQYFQPAANNYGAANPGFSNIGITGLAPFTRPFVAGTFQDGYQYKVNTQATDAATNVEVAFGTTTFVVDLTTPVASIAVPANNAWLGFSSLGSGLSLAGTADDSVENLRGFAAPRDFEAGIAAGGVG